VTRPPSDHLPAPGNEGRPQAERAPSGAPDTSDGPSAPGALWLSVDPVPFLVGRSLVELAVLNTADRPVQVGSHYHFAEANPALRFDRQAAWGHRLAVPAGTSVRFEPGVERMVVLVPLGGRRVVPGLRRAAAGRLDPGPGADPDGGRASRRTGGRRPVSEGNGHG